MIRTFLLLCLMVMISEQMSFYHKVTHGSEVNSATEKYSKISLSRSKAESLPVQSSSLSETTKKSKPQVYGLDGSNKDSNEEKGDNSFLDGELYGSDGDFDATDFEIVLGERINFQDSPPAKGEKQSNHKNKIGKSEKKFDLARVKRGLAGINTDDKLTLTSTALPLSTTNQPFSKDTTDNTTAAEVEHSSHDDLKAIESSGDGEILDGTTQELSHSNSSVRLTETPYTNYSRADAGNSTDITQDDEPLDAVTCNTGEDGQTCWEPSVDEFGGKDGTNQEEGNDGGEEVVLAETNMTRDGKAEDNSGKIQPTDSNDDGGTKTIFPLRTESTAVPSLEPPDIVKSDEVTQDSEILENLPTTATNWNEEESVLSTSEIRSTTPSNENGEINTSQITAKIQITIPSKEEENRTTSSIIEDQVPTASSSAPTNEDKRDAIGTTSVATTQFITSILTTEATTSLDTTADFEGMKTDLLSSDTTKPFQATTPISVTTAEEVNTTFKNTKDATKTVALTPDISESSTAQETTPQSANTTTKTTEPPNTIPIPTTTAKTTVIPETTSQTTIETKSTTPSPILGGPCSSSDQQGDESPQQQLCGNLVGVDCVNGVCQCNTEWYQLGDTCKEWRLSNDFELKITPADKTSFQVSWRTVELSHSFDLLEFRVRWNDITNLPASMRKRLLGEARLIRSTRSVTTIAGDTQISGPNLDDIDNGNIQITNETVALIQKLTPGSKYVIQVTALIKVQDTGRTEELWYPQKSYRMDPYCLSWSDDDAILVQKNRTMFINFQRLEGTFYKCYINIKPKNLKAEGFTEMDCQTFSLSPFEFDVEYEVITKVTAGKSEAKFCRKNTQLVRESKTPDEVCKLEVSQVTGKAFTLTWDPPCTLYGYLTSYEVTLQSKDTCRRYKFIDSTMMEAMTEGDQSDVADADTKRDQGTAAQTGSDCAANTKEISRPILEQQSFTFSDLNVDTLYRVRVVAVNKKGRGQEMKKEVTTLSLVPTMPGKFVGSAVGLNEILLTWEPPTPYPGRTEYIISEFMTSNWKAGNSALKLFYTVTVQGYTNDSYTIKKLQMAKTYSFEIEARTTAGTSPAASTGPVQTWETESPPVTDLTLTDETFNSVYVSWKAPPQRNGNTRAYIVVVKTIDEKCSQALAIVNDKTYLGPQQRDVPSLDEALTQSCPAIHATKIPYGGKNLKTELTVSGLKPNTQYNIVVAAYNGAGLGQQRVTTGKTKNAVPSAPTQFTCSPQGRGELNFSWKPPIPMPGQTSYSLIVEMADDENGRTFSSFSKRDIRGYYLEHLYLKQLRDFWHYRAYLKATTPAGSSLEVKTEVCRTVAAAPGKVSEMYVQYNYQNSTELQVKWTCPKTQDRHGILELFLLRVVATSNKRTDMKMEDIPYKEKEITVRNKADGSPDCSLPYTATVEIIPQITYAVWIKAKVKNVDDFGAVYEEIYAAPGAAPPPLPKPIRKENKNDKQKAFTFRTSICPTCLVNSRFGQPARYGLGVCLEGFCDVGSRANHSLKDYAKLASWKTSKAALFRIPYQIFDDWWKKLILEESKANHASVNYIVGNQASCTTLPDTELCNGPLPPESAFRVFQFSCTVDGCTESPLSDVTRTAAVKVSTPSSDKIVMGGAAAGVAVALIIILVIVIVRIRFRKVVEITEKGPDQEMQLSDITSRPDAAPQRSRPIKIKDFEEHLQQLHANNNDLFTLEFTELDMDSTVHPMTVGSDPQYRKLNRWSNILPYDHTRVKLKIVDGDEKCSDDYINANFLVGYRTSKDYIATQGPLTATVPDFWRMIWEQESSIIVMLSAFQEMDPRSGLLREKVAQYYPDEADQEGRRYDHVVVSWRGKLDNQAWEVRTFHLTHRLERRSRYVKHFFFKSWTDHKADISPSDLINFVNTVRDEAESHPPGPIVVHCSAGVGRTGTFIAVDYFCRYIKELTKGSKLSKISDVMGSLRGSWAKRKSMIWEDSTIDVYGRIIALRDCRRYMVQTKSQYAFIYDTVMELIRRVSRGDDQSESGCDTESCFSEPLPVASTPGSNDAVYDDVDVLKQ